MSREPIFVTGIARGGTSLVGRMLDAHPRMAVAIDACLPLFRALRNSMVMAVEPDFDPSRPMEDGYFDPAQRARQKDLLNGRIDLPLRGTSLDDLRAALQRRANDEAGDLAPLLAEISGDTMRALIDEAMTRIANARPGSDLARVGFKDLWMIDLIPALARAYPQARFIVVFRDPRDIIASVLGFLTIDPGQVGHVLSFLRHWRKSVALAYRFARDPSIDPQFMTLRYEDVVANPGTAARRMCEFVGVAFDDAMIQMRKFKEYNAGGRWHGNSTFDTKLDTISRAPIGRWRKHLDPAVVALIEFACSAEMRACGYEPEGVEVADQAILDFLVADDARECSWRSDFHDPVADFARERTRRDLLALPQGQQPDGDKVADAFLFEDVYAALRTARTPIVRAMS